MPRTFLPVVRASAILLALGSSIWSSPIVAQQLALDSIPFPDSLRNDVAQVAPVYREFPRDASVLYQVAALHAKAGHMDAALAALRRMADLKAGADPRLRDGFQRLAENSEFKAIRARIQRDFPPVNRARLAFDVVTGRPGPEGIAWSATTRQLYFSGLQSILAVDSTGRFRPFVAEGTAPLGGVLGMRVDDSRGELWATSTGFGGAPPGAVIGLHRFRLADGMLLGSYPIPDSTFGFVNDVAIGTDGVAYATASNTGALLRVDPRSSRVDAFLPVGTLADPNGIVASGDGRYLFVAAWYGITRVDLKTRKTLMLPHATSIASGCNDGLYMTDQRTLIGVQNCIHATGRVVRYNLSQGRDSIVSAEVLESYNPLFDGVTTAALAGQELYFVANVQFRKLGPGLTMIGPLDPFHVLRLSVGHSH